MCAFIVIYIFLLESDLSVFYLNQIKLTWRFIANSANGANSANPRQTLTFGGDQRDKAVARGGLISCNHRMRVVQSRGTKMH